MSGTQNSGREPQLPMVTGETLAGALGSFLESDRNIITETIALFTDEQPVLLGLIKSLGAQWEGRPAEDVTVLIAAMTYEFLSRQIEADSLRDNTT